jgi:hypothetical protein
MSDQDADDEWEDHWMTEVNNLGEMLAAMDKTNPWRAIPLLPAAMNYLMTEL